MAGGVCVAVGAGCGTGGMHGRGTCMSRGRALQGCVRDRGVCVAGGVTHIPSARYLRCIQ